MNQVTVIRIIKYTGNEADVARTIAKSMALGEHQKPGYTITVAEHLNELSPQIMMDDSLVQGLLSGAELIREAESLTTGDGPFMETIIEAKAKEIYDTWQHHENWVPWVSKGNSIKQDEARKCARRFYEEL